MKDFTLPASVEQDKIVLSPQAKSTLRTRLRGVKDGTPILITVEKQRAHRSLDANAYYWGCVLRLISEYNGDEVYDLHEFFKKRFNPQAILGDTIGGSTAKMNTLEFTEYIEKIRRFALMELGVSIPDPDVEWRQKMSAA
jgi:hypothetical protein